MSEVLLGRRSRDRRDGRAGRRRARRRRSDRRGRGRRSARRPVRSCSTPTGCVVAPGLVDIQVHFREPGREEAETIETGARGRRARRLHRGGVHAEHRTSARRRRGRAVGARARAATPPARCTSPAASRRAGAASSSRRWASSTTSVCACSPTTVTAWPTRASCAVRSSISPRCPTRCFRSTRRIPRSYAAVTCTRARGRRASAFPGDPPIAESSIVARDLALARLTGGRYHVLHVSSGQTVELIRGREGGRRARHRGVHAAASRAHRCRMRRIRSGVQDESAASASKPDVDALRAGLIDGTIDAIATDHAPHTPETKAAAVRGGAARDARGRDRTRGRAHDAGRAGCADSLADALGALSWRPARSPASTRTATADRSPPAAPRTSA